ncbi:putative ABC transport system permease protein [Streptomyces sp. SAI-117]|uniref:ABC transporter permease n=1 Tax=unclassified Streptomyces TaxID=2593676 RepID=UPI002473EA16|nr:MULTISPECIES: FtsX-like permease family protein [unclassified Streptomyces]MDH6553541.1 putative ABC transport system permease protein [Streptomyces sp. SAI-041]MDH6572623.1 putative ABC transport system permease protein [Streptomyces sp. SAI-117]MDH6582417.1 putative ABC transport system permease protein [Streptomyces sp. SAI-133]
MTGPLVRVVRSGVGRRRVQTVVIAIATMMAVAAAVVAGSLMVVSDAPFDRAFAEQHGAHLIAEFDPAKAGAAQLGATGKLAGVTASAGPYPTTILRVTDSAGRQPPAMTLVGRTGPRAAVDDLDLTAGRWARKPGEVVLSSAYQGPAFGVGDTLTASGTTLTVVGFATSASRTADVWATPAQVRALAAKDTPVSSQMLYRFDAAGSKGDIAADRKKLLAAVPAGALLGTQSYLDTKRAADQGAAPTIPFLVAFGVLGIVMSVIIVGSVISGAVGTGLRRIGILKAIGFTPREVVRAYVAQALVPASVGIALGVVLGNLLAVPLLDDTEQAYGTAGLSVAWWVDVVVPAGALLVVGIAAFVPALRAGRLRTVEAIAVGRAPRTGRGQWAHRAAGRLPLPRAVTYGLASPFAHPVRTLAMLLAVAFGTIAATFAVGLTSSLNEVSAVQDPESRSAVTVFTGGPSAAGGEHIPAPGTPVPEPADPAKVSAAIEAQAGTASYYGVGQQDATVAGVSGTVRATLFQGDSTRGGYAMISGHWLTGAGQVVVSGRFLDSTGTEIGDTVRVSVGKETATLRIVGEAFGTSDDELEIQANLADFPATAPQQFMVDVKPGVTPAVYAEKLAAQVEPLGADARANSPSQQDNFVFILNTMAVLLTLMLVSVAGLGVLNSVVLDTRERVHDLGVCKALGMSPRQTVSLVLASVAGIGVLGGVVGVPAGYALHGFVLPVMGHAAGTELPRSVLDVYATPQLVLLGLAGLAIALLGALLPAAWAAGARTATALRTE